MKKKYIKPYILDSAIFSFSNDCSLSEILITCSLYDVNVDFIDIKEVTHNYNYKIIKVIDTHKEDVAKYVDKIDCPRYYTVISKNKKDILKYMVVDKLSQSLDIDILTGKYDINAVIACFKKHTDAVEYAKKLNDFSC